MISPSRHHPIPPEASPTAPGRRPDQNPDAERSPYGVPFWRAYLATTFLMVAIALLFRYADFVTVLGGTELHLGWIVGVGMVGSLLMRVVLGTWIDRYGPRRVWLGSLALFAASCFGHLLVTDYAGPGIYVLRIAYCSALAGVFGAAMTFISGRAPVVRAAEMIGMLGTSGFLGMILGTQLGDLLLGTPTIQRWQVDRMFTIAGTLAVVAVVFAWGATRNEPRPVRRRRPPLAWLLRRYHPGTVLLVSVANGVALALPSTFLRPYAAELEIPRIGLFFAVYAPAAIVTRVLTRRLPERLGLTPMILLGLGLMIVGQLLLLVVDAEWMLVVPAVGYGMGHAVVFPTTIAAGMRAFPSRYRGLGTTLMLAGYDLGNLVGAPAAGAIVHFSVMVGVPGYPAMFVSVATVLALVGVTYALTGRRWKKPRRRARPPRSRELSERVEQRPLVGVGAEE
jgi:MFS family permease